MMKPWGLLSLLTLSAWGAVDINTATLSELEAVKGIGPKKALAIVAYRQRHGPFKRIETLVRVGGFGQASVAKLQGKLTVGDHGEDAAPRSR